jgi:hypothetical protein
MEAVIRGGGVVSGGVGRFVCAYGLRFSGRCQAERVRDSLGVSLRMRGRLFDASRVAFITKWQRVIFGATRRYSANE